MSDITCCIIILCCTLFVNKDLCCLSDLCSTLFKYTTMSFGLLNGLCVISFRLFVKRLHLSLAVRYKRVLKFVIKFISSRPF